jgi:hypothetical protein
VSLDLRIVDQGPQVFAVQLFDLVDFVEGAKTIEEMQEGNPRRERGCMRNQGKVLYLLDRIGGEQGPACGACRHHIGMIPKDRECLRGE